MMSQILMFVVDSPNPEKSKYLENKSFKKKIKKSIHYTLRAIISKKKFPAEVTFQTFFVIF